MNTIRENTGFGKHSISAVAICCGNDINISIAGGEKKHIGAVAIGVPKDKTKVSNVIINSATTSVICVQDHKEDEYAYLAAKHLATELDCVVTVSVGIHIDNVVEKDLEILSNNFKEIIERLEKSLKLRGKNKSTLSYF